MDSDVPLEYSTLSTRKSRVLPAILVCGFIAIVIVLVVARIVITASLENVHSSNAAVTHTYKVKIALEKLVKIADDAETGQRGFVITGDTNYLQPYNQARATIAANAEQVRTLTADNPAQQEDLQQLTALTEKKLEELGRVIDERRVSGLAAAQRIVANNTGKHTMDDMRAVLARMEAREDSLMDSRVADADRSYRTVQTLGFATTGIALLVVIALFIGTRRMGKERDRLQQSEERFRHAIESAPAAMVIIDQNGTIRQVNTLLEDIFGYARGEILGQSIERLVPERFRGIHPRHRTNFFADSRPRRMGAGRDLFALHRDGTEIPVEIGLSPISTSDGMFVIAAVTDITERKRASEREQEAKRDAEKANRVKDEFLAVLSHELRTPLSAIMSWAEVLESGPALEAELRQEATQGILRGVQLETHLIDSLLDLSRIMSEKLNLEMERLDVRPVVQAAVDIVRPGITSKKLRLDVRMPDVPLILTGDPTRLQQIVWNLLTNAAKFTPAGGKIEIVLEQRDASTDDRSYAQLRVTDSGSGIPANFLPHIFDRFAQEKMGGPGHRGLGLGLAIVRELVLAHGGTIRADSAGPGQGSTFIVRLPLAMDAVPTLPSPAAVSPAEFLSPAAS